MTHNTIAGLLIARSAATMAQVAGLQAHNDVAKANGGGNLYGQDAFVQVEEQHEKRVADLHKLLIRLEGREAARHRRILLLTLAAVLFATCLGASLAYLAIPLIRAAQL